MGGMAVETVCAGILHMLLLSMIWGRNVLRILVCNGDSQTLR